MKVRFRTYLLNRWHPESCELLKVIFLKKSLTFYIMGIIFIYVYNGIYIIANLNVEAMPPKTKFTRDDIIDAAFRLMDGNGAVEGIIGLSTWKIAEKKKSSVQPIYSHFNSINDLKFVLAVKARDILRSYVHRKYTGTAYLDLWIGEVFFAQEHPNLYFALFLERNDYEDIFFEVNKESFHIFSHDPNTIDMPDTYIQSFYRHMQVYTYGMAVMKINRFWRDDTLEGIVRVINDVGTLLLKAAQESKILEKGEWFINQS